MTGVINPERARREVVVIGASAGGVTALRELFAKFPSDMEAAVAVVLHRSPVAESALAPVLGWRAALPVVEAVDGMPLQRASIHLAPRDQHLRIDGETLRLSPAPGRVLAYAG